MYDHLDCCLSIHHGIISNKPAKQEKDKPKAKIRQDACDYGSDEYTFGKKKNAYYNQQLGPDNSDEHCQKEDRPDELS